MEKRKRRLGKLLERKIEREMGEGHTAEKNQTLGEEESPGKFDSGGSRDIEIKRWQKKYDKVSALIFGLF